MFLSETRFVLKKAINNESKFFSGLKTVISSGTSTGEISATLHQERYFSCIVSATPNSTKSYKPSYSDSLTSLDSLMLSGVQDILPETPEVVRRSHPATGSMRNINNPKSSCKYHTDIHVGRTYSWLINVFIIYMLYMYVH